MFDWLFKAKCPVPEKQQAWLEGGLNWLGEQFDPQRMLQRPIILPTPEFFPDPYDGSQAAVEALFARVCHYMEIGRDRVFLYFFVNQRDGLGPLLSEGRTDGAAGLYQSDELGRVAIGLDATLLADPAQVVATMAHELAHVHLLGDGRVSSDSPDHEPLTDLLTVLYGLGIFSANSVIQESNWQEGLYSGWSVGRQGYLTGPEYGYALALIAHARGESNPSWASHLRLDVRSTLKKGLRYLRSIEEKPFPKELKTCSAHPAEERLWTRPKPSTDQGNEEDDLPPWAKKNKT